MVLSILAGKKFHYRVVVMLTTWSNGKTEGQHKRYSHGRSLGMEVFPEKKTMDLVQ